MSARIRRRSPADIGLPAPVVYELYYGAWKSRQTSRNLELLDRTGFEIVPFDASDERMAGASEATQAVEVRGLVRALREVRQPTRRNPRLAPAPVAAQQRARIPELRAHRGAGEGETALGGRGMLGGAQRPVAVAEAGGGAEEPAGGGHPAHRDAATHQLVQCRRGDVDVAHGDQLGQLVET